MKYPNDSEWKINKQVSQHEQRIVIARMLITIMRLLSQSYLENERFGASADETLLCAALFIGQAERRPMNASKLSEYVGIPRPSVIRKMNVLRKAGLVGRYSCGAYFLPDAELEHPGVIDALTAVKKAIHNASMRLSKMDTEAIATGSPLKVYGGN